MAERAKPRKISVESADSSGQSRPEPQAATESRSRCGIFAGLRDSGAGRGEAAPDHRDSH